MEFKPLSVKDYLALTFPDNDIIGSGILTAQSVLVLGGHPGIGKSVMVTQMGYELSQGKDILNTFKAKKSKVLLLQEEIGPKNFQNRLIKVVSHYGDSDSFLIISSASFTFDDPILVLHLKSFIIKYSVEIVILDPLYKIHGRNESDPTDMARLFQLMSKLINDLKISVILVHHLRKPPQLHKGEVLVTGMMDFRGSAIQAWADTMMLIEETDVKDRIRLSFPKTRNAPEEIRAMYLTFDRDHLRFSTVNTGSQPINIKEEILGILSPNGGISEANLLSQFKCKYGKEVNTIRIKSELQILKRVGAVNLSGGLLNSSVPQSDPGDPWATQW